MSGEKKDGRSAPRIPAGVMRVLCERLAARVDTAASMVEPGHFVSGYCSDDPSARHRLAVELERTFNVSIDSTAMDSVQTVQELAELIVRLKNEPKQKNGRVYIIVYKNEDGRVVETHVHARNHNEAVDSLRAEGLSEVLSVQRADDEDNDRGHWSVRNGWTGCVIPFLIALLTGAAVVGFYWLCRH